MITRRTALMNAAGAAVAAIATPALAEAPHVPESKPSDLPLQRQKIDLVAPPFVHAHEHATRQIPKIMEVTLTIHEKKIVVDGAGTTLQAMTYNGSIPAPLIVVHEGDYVELTLVNPGTNTLQHNIDFHASTGGLGGGALTHVSPGEQVVLRWKATRPGVFIYHCAPGGVMILSFPKILSRLDSHRKTESSHD